MQMGRDFFTKAYEEDSSDVEQVVDTPVDEVVVPEVVAPEVTEVAPVVPNEVPVDKYTIDGEDVTLDQIKEWKQNGLRQSDYTRKTQELAEQRKHANEYVSDLDEPSTPTDSDRILALERDIKAKELDLEITNLKAKYPDFDEIKVLTESGQRGIYDLEFIYKGLRETTNSSFDMEAVKAQAILDYKTQIATQIQANKDSTSDSIISNASAPTVIDYGDSLTSSEKEFARKRGWSEKQYAEMKEAEYKV